MWSATFTSSLASKYPNKEIKYYISSYLTTTYTGAEGSTIKVWYFLGGGKEYATAKGNVYSASVSAPQYLATEEDGKDIDPPVYLGDIMSYIHELDGLIEIRNTRGYLSSDQEARYYELKDLIQSSYWLCDYVHSWLGLFVEIDGIHYRVKEQEGKVRLPWDG